MIIYFRFIFEEMIIMSDHSGDWIISFNGEIYNHLEIRKYLSEKIQD